MGGTLKLRRRLFEVRPDRLRHDLGQLPREECPADRRHFRRCRQARHDRRRTNPARPGATGWVSLDSYWNARDPCRCREAPSAGRPRAPAHLFVRTEGLVSAQCAQRRAARLFVARTNADPNDKRTDRVGGEVGVMGMFIPGWGMHSPT